MNHQQYQLIKVILCIIIAILITGIVLQCSAQTCPVGGDNSRPHLQHQDSLKNRLGAPSLYVETPFNTIANSPVTYSLPYWGGISIHGYVLEVKYGGSETCNCHTTDKNQFDTHIVLVSDSTVTDPCNGIVCEITPRSRPLIGLNTLQVKQKYLHRYVTISGWIFNDDEHAPMSKADKCHANNCHRATCWEIHPVTNIIFEGHE